MSTGAEAIVTNAITSNGIKTGDAVFVGNETWLVAFVENGRVWCCGWPLSNAPAEKVRLKRMGTVEAAVGLLRDMAVLTDLRGEYARRKLAEIEAAMPEAP